MEQSCVPGWPALVCRVGNAAGVFSAALWFACLVPQLALNARRRSVEGLSAAWAAANFAASLANLNFALRVPGGLPTYAIAQGVYLPLLEAALLAQFALWDARAAARRGSALLLLVAGATTVTAAVFWPAFGAAAAACEWEAVALWSAETAPQLWLNCRRRSAAAQAPATLAIAGLGKATDYLSMACLRLPLQYRVMAFFSSGCLYLNLAQWFWYRNRKGAAGGCALVVAVAFAPVQALKVGPLWGALALPALLLLATRGGTLFFSSSSSSPNFGVREEERGLLSEAPSQR